MLSCFVYHFGTLLLLPLEWITHYNVKIAAAVIPPQLVRLFYSQTIISYFYLITCLLPANCHVLIYLSIHGCCIRKITLGSRGAWKFFALSVTLTERIINLNLWVALKDLDLPFSANASSLGMWTHVCICSGNVLCKLTSFLLMLSSQICSFSLSEKGKRQRWSSWLAKHLTSLGSGFPFPSAG